MHGFDAVVDVACKSMEAAEEGGGGEGRVRGGATGGARRFGGAEKGGAYGGPEGSLEARCKLR